MAGTFESRADRVARYCELARQALRNAELCKDGSVKHAYLVLAKDWEDLARDTEALAVKNGLRTTEKQRLARDTEELATKNGLWPTEK